MSTTSTAKPLGKGDLGPPDSPTSDQAGRFFALLIEMGFADSLDRLYQGPEQEVVGDRPTSLAEAAGVQPDDDGDRELVLDLGTAFRAIGHHGAYDRLAEIMWDLPEGEGGAVRVEQIADFFFGFAVDCSAPFNQLREFVLDWV